MAVGFSSVRLSPRGGRVLFVIVAVIGVAVVASFVVTGQLGRALTLSPAIGFVALAVWVMFWAPAVVIDESSVTVVNPLRTYRLPWSSITGTETRWALTLITPGRRITAWAVPRPSRAAGIEMRRDAFGLPDFAAEQQFERQSAQAATASVAERVIAKRLADYGEHHATGEQSILINLRWHVAQIIALVILLVAAIVLPLSVAR